jgi:hypothetical protein
MTSSAVGVPTPPAVLLMLEWFLYLPLDRLTNNTEKNKPIACKAGWEAVVVSGLKFSRVTKTFSHPVPLLDSQRVVPSLGALARHPQMHGLEIADVHTSQRAHARQRRVRLPVLKNAIEVDVRALE